MKSRVFYTDINLYGHDERDIFLESGFSYYVGNIVDLKHTEREKEAIRKINEIKSFAKDRYITGDRELTNRNLQYIIDDEILVTYGDHIIEGHRDTKRTLLCYAFNGIHNYFDKLLRRKEPNEFDLELIIKEAKNNKCHTIVMSYFNNKKIIDFEYKNIRIIILPKGRTCIQI